jgi:hypothetical protein
MADRRDLEIPTGTPHDIAVMAFRIAERAMAHIEQHERICGERWDIQRQAMEGLRHAAESNFQIGAADRKDMREAIATLQAKATSVVMRLGIWLLTAMAGGLVGAIWFIVTHKWV